MYQIIEKNPYLLGKADYHAGFENLNPFDFPTEKWALYNRGYNSCWLKREI